MNLEHKEGQSQTQSMFLVNYLSTIKPFSQWQNLPSYLYLALSITNQNEIWCNYEARLWWSACVSTILILSVVFQANLKFSSRSRGYKNNNNYHSLWLECVAWRGRKGFRLNVIDFLTSDHHANDKRREGEELRRI